MDNDAGHKRKELKSNVKRWWHDWFGDIPQGAKKVVKDTYLEKNHGLLWLEIIGEG